MHPNEVKKKKKNVPTSCALVPFMLQLMDKSWPLCRVLLWMPSSTAGSGSVSDVFTSSWSSGPGHSADLLLLEPLAHPSPSTCCSGRARVAAPKAQQQQHPQRQSLSPPALSGLPNDWWRH